MSRVCGHRATVELSIDLGQFGEYRYAVCADDVAVFSEHYVSEVEDPAPFPFPALPTDVVADAIAAREFRGDVIRAAAKKLAESLIKEIEKSEGWKIAAKDLDRKRPGRKSDVEPVFLGTRAEHIEACKQRALVYVDKGDLPQALASMSSDLSKHIETRDVGRMMGPLGLHAAMEGADALRRWIEGF